MGYEADGPVHAGCARARVRRARAGDGRVRRPGPARRGDDRRRREGERLVLGQGIADAVVKKLKAAIDGVGEVMSAPLAYAHGRARAVPDWRRASPTARSPRSCAAARSGCSTPASAGSPSCTSCSCSCPHEDFVYLATPRASRTASARPAELEAFALEVAEELIARRIKLLVVACNSATAAALPALRERLMQTTLGVDVLGVVQPGAVQAVAATRNGRVGLLATPATVASGAYAGRSRDADPFVDVTAVACPDLAAIIERGFPFDQRVVDTVRRYCAPLREAEVDTVVLGCTHYPLVAPDAPAHARPRGGAGHLGRAAEGVVGVIGRALTGAALGVHQHAIEGEWRALPFPPQTPGTAGDVRAVAALEHDALDAGLARRRPQLLQLVLGLLPMNDRRQVGAQGAYLRVPRLGGAGRPGEGRRRPARRRSAARRRGARARGIAPTAASTRPCGSAAVAGR